MCILMSDCFLYDSSRGVIVNVCSDVLSVCVSGNGILRLCGVLVVSMLLFYNGSREGGSIA